MPNEKKNKEEKGSIEKRLDALIRLNCEILIGSKMDKTSLIKTLNSSGLSPLEIARIMGKKSATDMAPFLYSKKKEKKEEI